MPCLQYLFSLSLYKAAQFSLTTGLSKEFWGPKGVHCALVVVAGQVMDDAENYSAGERGGEDVGFARAGQGGVGGLSCRD